MIKLFILAAIGVAAAAIDAIEWHVPNKDQRREFSPIDAADSLKNIDGLETAASNQDTNIENIPGTFLPETNSNLVNERKVIFDKFEALNDTYDIEIIEKLVPRKKKPDVQTATSKKDESVEVIYARNPSNENVQHEIVPNQRFDYGLEEEPKYVPNPFVKDGDVGDSSTFGTNSHLLNDNTVGDKIYMEIHLDEGYGYITKMGSSNQNPSQELVYVKVVDDQPATSNKVIRMEVVYAKNPDNENPNSKYYLEIYPNERTSYLTKMDPSNRVTSKVEVNVTYPDLNTLLLRGNNAHGQRYGEGNARILNYESEIGRDGHYYYAYETENGIKAEEEGVLKTYDNNETGEDVEGFYSYTSPEQIAINVKYYADKYGFKPETLSSVKFLGPHKTTNIPRDTRTRDTFLPSIVA